MLLERIRPEKNEAVLVGDEAPARAGGFAAGLGIRPPDCVDDGPVHEPEKKLADDGEQDQRQKPVQQLHLATRELYQFINAEMARLMVRYTIMMIAMPSIAWPVWFMV